MLPQSNFLIIYSTKNSNKKIRRFPYSYKQAGKFFHKQTKQVKTILKRPAVLKS